MNDKPDANFMEQLLQCEQEARELREKLATLLHIAPQDPAAWFATFTNDATARGLGLLLMITGKSAAWVDKAVSDSLKVLNAQLPQAEVLQIIDLFIEGQIDAEVCCSCGDCVPCAYRAKHGVQETRRYLAQQLRPKRHVLYGANGRPLH